MRQIELNNRTILVTGAAGFIGSNLAKRLCDGAEDVRVIGVDNMNDYYDVRLKEARLKELTQRPSFLFVKGNIAEKPLIMGLFEQYRPQIVVNLAAHVGVRYSIYQMEK